MSTDIHYLCPLKIPHGYQLSFQRQRRYDNGFPQTLSLDDAVVYLEDELKGLTGAHVSVFSNYDRLNSPRTRAKREDDSAVCVEIRLGTRSYYLICDRWYLVEHNIYALHLAVRAMRNMVKWGVGSIEQVLAGFDAAFDSAAGKTAAHVSAEALPEWMHVLGLGANATLDDANTVYRRRAKEAANANDEDRLMQLNAAIEAARTFFGA